ncbi:Redoxin [Morchella snyderi]|nr:Redoxin [Morchella snyderi]
MSAMKPGDKFPAGVTFSWVPYTEEKSDVAACGRQVELNASDEWADKKVVLFAVPGAFTPGCSEKHLPSYIRNYNELKNKGIDVIAVIAYNDAHVMAAWGKANSVKGDDILFLSDTGNKFSESIGWTNGPRLARYALVIDKGIVTYAAKDNKGEVNVSAAEAVLAKL